MNNNRQIDEKQKLAEKIHEKARYMRGTFLNSVAVIERDIALLLTRYFCKKDEPKRELFFNKVARKLSLNRKKEILIDIVKSDELIWENCKHALIDLQKIIEFRNQLAHSVVDVSKKALYRPLTEGVGFISWKEGEPITDREFDQWNARTTRVSSSLNIIKELFPS